MHSTQELQERVKQIFSTINFDSEPKELYQPISYTLSLGGKRIRPLLVLMSCDMFGGDLEHAVNPSIGIEIFHNFTLLHDDIMDQSPIRRGKETVYKKWNTNIAILSGDVMFALAYKYLIKTNNKDILPALLELFNQTAIEVCEGQQYDMNYETATDVSIADYIEMIRLKTSVLLGASLKVGAIIAKAIEKDIDNIYKFGINIGLAFQLKDDLLDVFGDESVFGKKTGSDIITNKKTFLYLKAFELAKGETLEKLKYLFSTEDIDAKTKINSIKEIYTKLDIKQYTEQAMNTYHRQALAYLHAIKLDASCREPLAQLAKKLMVREY